MGSDQEKIEKKRLKAQVKVEKARAKAGLPSKTDSPPEEQINKSWYNDPNWVRAIVAIASLVIMIITMIIMLI